MVTAVNNSLYLEIRCGRHSTFPISSTLRLIGGKQRFEKQTIFRVVKFLDTFRFINYLETLIQNSNYIQQIHYTSKEKYANRSSL
jgi:hypothetical protein